MEALRNVFFFIGSVLGILAFFRPLLDPILERNRQRWKEAQQIATEANFANLEFETSGPRHIRSDTLWPVRRLMLAIEERPECLRLGPFLKKYYDQELNELLRLYICFRELVQVPEWEPTPHPENADQEFGWSFNKAAFDKGKGYAEDYADHLYVASWYAQRMRNTYRRLSVLADIQLVEMPLARWIVPKRMSNIELNT